MLSIRDAADYDHCPEGLILRSIREKATIADRRRCERIVEAWKTPAN